MSSYFKKEIKALFEKVQKQEKTENNSNCKSNKKEPLNNKDTTNLLSNKLDLLNNNMNNINNNIQILCSNMMSGFNYILS